MVWMMEFRPSLNPESDAPLYRQLYGQIAVRIRSGEIGQGSRLPATRELAGLLGVNRATVAAAYELLENEGLIAGQVGRGSFVRGIPAERGPVNWGVLLERSEAAMAGPGGGLSREIVSFAVSRPSREMFPLDDFRASCEAVLNRADLADILQLGSPGGYEPLRRRLLEDARRQRLAGPGDDLIITNGCQQALDLIGRVLLRPGDLVLVEDPTYPGLKNLLAGMGAQLVGVPVGAAGIDVAQAVRALERERPRFLVVTPNFQNPTGATMPAESRRALLDAARSAGCPVIENDPYGELRYLGQAVPSIKELDERGGTALLRSFSKVSFPGLRVGWALGPKPLLERMRQAKEASDLHTDQLSQAALLEFLESGRLEAHKQRVLRAGRERLEATLEGCRVHLPSAQWTRPEGGMNIWLRLPAPLDAGELLARAHKEGVAYLPARYFEVTHHERGAMRLSFAGLSPDDILRGLAALGRVVTAELEGFAGEAEPAPAMV